MNNGIRSPKARKATKRRLAKEKLQKEKKLKNKTEEENEYYQPYENNQLKCFRAKTECLVIRAFNGDLLVTVDEKVYELRRLKSHKKFSEEFDAIPEPKKEKKKYIPPMTHPWKIASFKKQLEKAHTEHVYA